MENSINGAAAKRLHDSIAYFAYNYGDRHALTLAAIAGDLRAFRAAACHITQNFDVRAADLCDLIRTEVTA